MGKKKASQQTPDSATEAFNLGCAMVKAHPIFRPLLSHAHIIRSTNSQNLCPRDGWAVVDSNGWIYAHPTRRGTSDEWAYIIAHCLLHLGFEHLFTEKSNEAAWNVACDYVINGWLVEMHIGTRPDIDLLYDPELKGLSAEVIYDRLTSDLRRARKLNTLRGYGLGDMIGSETSIWMSDGLTLDEFCRRSLSQGLEYHLQQNRGYLPADLIEEIRSLAQSPIKWDVKLALWFQDHFFPLERRRNYARPSRRQASTPDIPRSSWHPPKELLQSRTFGVVLDTSGSMSRVMLGQALGAIASYSLANEVPAACVIFCDTITYDQGYMSPEDIAGRVQIRGRGGTILQPGIDLLEHAEDFPKDGPILIITDGFCDVLTIQRSHAYLLPAGRSLPFVPRGVVFWMEP
ncbi:MAG: hypothetical protein ACHQUC_07490 [Chlamydiales bacterium]